MSGEWGAVVDKIARRFEVAAALGYDAVHNPVGADAVAKVMRTMAEKLDRAVELQLAQKPKRDILDLAEAANDDHA